MTTTNVYEWLKGKRTANKYYVGPEWFGCINTGRRPMLWHWSEKNNNIFVVGWELDVKSIFDLYYKDREMVFWLFNNRFGKHKKKDCWKFRTRQTALKKFQALCDKVDSFNETEKEKADSMGSLYTFLA